MRARFQCLGGWAVFHQQDATRSESSQKEPRIDIFDRRRRFRLTPGDSLIRRETLMWPVRSAREHPETSVAQLDHHVFVVLPTGKFHASALLPTVSLIGGFIDSCRFFRPVRNREQPVAIAEDGGLVESAARAEIHRGRPFRSRRIGIVAADIPVSGRTGSADNGLIEKQPQAPQRIGPEIANQRGAGAFSRRVGRAYHEPGL